MLKNSKFMKLYNVVMQSYGDAGFDPMSDYGRSAYNLRAFNTSQIQNKAMRALQNGQPVIDPYDGQPVYWEVVAAHYPGYDCITRKKFPSNTVVFSYKPSKQFTDKARKYVCLTTYENAYNNDDQVTIQKLQNIGLLPGFDYQ